MSNFVIWVSDLWILSLGLLYLWFGFAMHSFGFFLYGIREREREQDQTFMLERRTGDLRNDVGLSPGEILRHVDLEIGSFTGDINLWDFFALHCSSFSLKICDLVVGFLCILLDFFFFFFVTVGGVNGSGI